MLENKAKMLGAVIDEDEIKRRGSAVWPYVHFKPGTPVDPAEIDKLVVALVKREHEKAYRILEENRAKLDELAQYLYEKETITGEEFMAILNQK